MFVDPSFFDGADVPPVVIIGSGPAGVTLAVDLAARGTPSLILEAGERDFSGPAQDAYMGQVIGDPYYDLDTSRLRMFGGSSNHWAGWCRPLDAWDFQAKDHVPDTGWPIAKTDLDPYAAAARDILEVPETQDSPLDDTLFETGFEQSPPVQFGIKYDALFQGSSLAHVALSSPVSKLTPADDAGRVTIHFQDAAGQARTLTPQVAVLACGGIENARVLLWSNAAGPGKLIADDRALGRYWMEHPHATIGHVRIEKAFDTVPLYNGEIRVAPTPKMLDRHRILNGSLRFYRTYQGAKPMQDRVKRVICNAEPYDTVALEEFGRRIQCTSAVAIAWEQAPRPENRVALSGQARDDRGIPLTELHWRKAEVDYRTPKVILELLGRFLLDDDRGLVRAAEHTLAEGAYPDDGLPGGFHHLGGTRMSDDPATGVVDRNLQVFGQPGLYVAGSSTFPTGGHANPTFTIVQLSLRLAEHLAGRLSP